MYLSPYKHSDDSDQGTYFSYRPSDNRAKNIKICLPGGFSGSGAEYEMYKNNCLELMADQCKDEWGKECDLYVYNLDNKQAGLFSEMVNYRKNAYSKFSTHHSCHKLSGIANGQVEVRGINPTTSGDSSYNQITHPRSCPPSSVKILGTSDSTAEQLMKQRYHQTLTNTEFPFSREVQAPPVFRRERFQSEIIQKEMKDKHQFHHEQSIKYEKPRADITNQRREEFQSEMTNSKLNKESYISEWNPMRLQAQHYQMDSEIQVEHRIPKPQPFAVSGQTPLVATLQKFNPPNDLSPDKTPIPFYPSVDPPSGEQYPQPPSPFLPTVQDKPEVKPIPFMPSVQDKPEVKPIPFYPTEKKEVEQKTDITTLVKIKQEKPLPVLIEESDDATPISLLIPDSEFGMVHSNQEKEIHNILFGSDCGSTSCSIQKILQM